MCFSIKNLNVNSLSPQLKSIDSLIRWMNGWIDRLKSKFQLISIFKNHYCQGYKEIESKR